MFHFFSWFLLFHIFCHSFDNFNFNFGFPRSSKARHAIWLPKPLQNPSHATFKPTLLEASPASFFNWSSNRIARQQRRPRHQRSGPLGSLPKSPFQPSARSHIARILRLFWIWKLMDIPTIYGLLNGFLVQFFTAHPDFIMWYCPVGSFSPLKKESPIFRNRSKNIGRFQIG